MATIFHQVLIDAKPEKVYNAITEQEGISKWWIADCIVKPELNFINLFKVESYVNNKMKVVDLKSSERVEWLCIDSEDEWIGTHIIFELSTFKTFTRLNFKQTNWAQQTEFFASCNFHWARHLMMLKNLCESGINQVDKKEELKEIKKVKE